MVKRGQGEKNKDWMTKAIILLYIASNGPVQTDDVREYLRTLDRKPVKSKTLIYKHLKDLEVKYRLLARVSQGRGKTDSFIIVEGFEGFKNTYMFMKKANYERGLLKTAYYQNYVQTEDFREKIRIHFFKENLLKIYSAIKNYEESKPIIRELIGLLKTVEGNDIDQLYQVFRDRLQTPANNAPLISDPQKYMEVLTNLLIPTGQRDNFKLILASSPSAMNFILNSQYYDSNIMFHNLGAYFTPDISKDYGFLRKLFHYDPELDEGINLDLIMPIENVDLDILTTKTTRHLVNADSSFMVILRSLFISDIVEGRITQDDSPQELLKQIFSTNRQTGPQKIGTKVSVFPAKTKHLPTNNKKSSTKTRGVKE